MVFSPFMAIQPSSKGPSVSMHLIRKLNYNASCSDYGCLFVEAPDFQVNSAKSHSGTLLAHFDFGWAEDDTER
jgi:hypothetical protein